MVLFQTIGVVFVIVQSRSVVIPPWIWGLGIAALLVYVIWRGMRWTKGRGATRIHQAEVNERQKRAQAIFGQQSVPPQPAAAIRAAANPQAAAAEKEEPDSSR